MLKAAHLARNLVIDDLLSQVDWDVCEKRKFNSLNCSQSWRRNLGHSLAGAVMALSAANTVSESGILQMPVSLVYSEQNRFYLLGKFDENSIWGPSEIKSMGFQIMVVRGNYVDSITIFLWLQDMLFTADKFVAAPIIIIQFSSSFCRILPDYLFKIVQ